MPVNDEEPEGQTDTPHQTGEQTPAIPFVAPQEKKPSFVEGLREKVGGQVESFKAQRAANSAEHKELEAEKKAAREQAAIDRKEAEKAQAVQQAYDNEVNKKSTPQKIQEGVNGLRPFFAGMKQGITALPSNQPRREGGMARSSPRPMPFSQSQSGGFDITRPPQVRRFEQPKRLVILSTPYQGRHRSGKVQHQPSLLSAPMFGGQSKKGGKLHSILFSQPKGGRQKTGGLFSSSKMGVKMPKGGMIGLRLPKQKKQKNPWL